MGQPFIHLPRISPKDFGREMKRYWEADLRNVASDRLELLWGNMAVAFNDAIAEAYLLENGKMQPTRWRVLQPPTGTGKTQGTCLYAAMLAKANNELPPYGTQVGVLIVTRLIGDADKIVETINQLAGFPCAVARHSEKTIRASEMQKHDILVITHRAYVMALEALTMSGTTDLWSNYVEWNGGKRLLTVIDESIDNIVDQYRVTSADIRKVMSYLSRVDREAFPDEVSVLQVILEHLEKVELAATSDHRDETVSTAQFLWDGPEDQRRGQLKCVDMSGLRDYMRGLPFDRLALQKDSLIDRKRIAQLVDNTLRDIEAMLSRFAYYARKGNYHTLNSSQFLLPAELPGPVVLDATAESNVLWDLMGERALVQPVPDNTRSYRNVTLHVSRDKGLGKGTMMDKGEARMARLLHHLEGDLKDRSVLLVCHKDIEHHALSFEPKFKRYAVGHWGAIDGRNDWQDYDTAVIFGLPYRDNIWAFNTFFAIQGAQNDEWLRKPSWKEQPNFLNEMQVMQISASVVQAINRVRSRRVTDAEGNCPKTEVYIVLPQGAVGDEILRTIRLAMPGVQHRNWHFTLDGERPDVRRASYHQPLVSLMKSRLPGEISIKEICNELNISKFAKLNLQHDLRNATSSLSLELAEIGVTYHSFGHGRGARSLLIKST